MANVSWSISIQVAGGPTVSAREGPIMVEAMDRIEVIIEPDAKDKKVSLQPDQASSIHLLLIKSDQYGDGTKITFKVNNGTKDGPDIALTGPQFYSGGAVMRLGLDPQALKFSNTSDDPAQIEIFIARDATP
ncbi:hypothetical protein [Nitrosomonas sp.]|uniref:hypothetical protein n=1 Tax=Nitrosomonas sp. TaxID=42353 RepID=UPI0037CB929A